MSKNKDTGKTRSVRHKSKRKMEMRNEGKKYVKTDCE